jgi:hypothetical protein
MAMLSNYLENHFWDWCLRGQTFTPPATTYVALYTAAPTAAGGGTEVSGGSYARVAVTGSLANWAGTQGAGTTAASTGTSGTTSNNNAITFPTPTATWGSIVAVGILDAATAGNLLFFGNLTQAKNVNSGDPAPLFNAAALSLTMT